VAGSSLANEFAAATPNPLKWVGESSSVLLIIMSGSGGLNILRETKKDRLIGVSMNKPMFNYYASIGYYTKQMMCFHFDACG
jgi:hypothetical protein